MSEPSVARSFDHPNVQLKCHCGWTGLDADVTGWDVQADRNRVVRKCPNCGEAVPEWGTLPTVDGTRRIARGPLADAGHLDEDHG